MTESTSGNGKRAWLDILVDDITRQFQQVSAADLLNAIARFRAGEQNSRLRQSYPSSLSGWKTKRQAADILGPRMPGGDLLLRYLDVKYPGLKSEVAQSLSSQLEQSVKNLTFSTFDRVLQKEAARRGRAAPRKSSYW